MDIIISLAILVIVICVVWFLISQLPLPEPAHKFVIIAVVVVVAVIVIGFLASLGGGGGNLLHLGR